MAITEPICDICGSTESKTWMCQGGYQTCRTCSNDIQAFDLQPMKDDNLKMLLEVFLRRGRGDQITFEEIHKEKSALKFINFKTLWDKDSQYTGSGKVAE